MSELDDIFAATEKRYTGGRKRGGVTTPQGTQGFQHSHGFLVNREKNPKLSRAKRYETFSEIIANHPVVSAGIRGFLAVIQKTAWTVKPIDGDAESERQAKEIDIILNKMETSWPQVVKRAAVYPYYGFGLQEWTAKKLPSGVIGIADIEPRAQHTIERWDISNRGEIDGVEQRNPNTGALHTLPRRRLIYAVDDSLNDSPEGLGIMRQIVATADRLDAYLTLEDIGFDTDLRGVPVVRAPLAAIRLAVKNKSMTVDEANKKIAVIRQFVKDHQRKKSQGLMLDSETHEDRDGKKSDIYKYSVELLKGEGTAQADLQKAIRRCRDDIAMLLATSFLILGEDGAGSLALSKTKLDAFMLFVDSTLEYLASVFKRDLFRQIARLNGWDEDSLPDLKYEAPKLQDIIDITEGLRNMAAAGAVIDPADPVVDQVRGEMGLVARPEEVVPEAGFDPDMGGIRETPNATGKEPSAGENE